MPLYVRLESFDGKGPTWCVYMQQAWLLFLANNNPYENAARNFLCRLRDSNILATLRFLEAVHAVHEDIRRAVIENAGSLQPRAVNHNGALLF